MYKTSNNGNITITINKTDVSYLKNRYFLANKTQASAGYAYGYFALVWIGEGDGSNYYVNYANIVNSCVSSVSVSVDGSKLIISITTGGTRCSVASLTDIPMS